METCRFSMHGQICNVSSNSLLDISCNDSPDIASQCTFSSSLQKARPDTLASCADSEHLRSRSLKFGHEVFESGSSLHLLASLSISPSLVARPSHLAKCRGSSRAIALARCQLEYQRPGSSPKRSLEGLVFPIRMDMVIMW